NTFVADFIGLSNVVNGNVESTDGPILWIRIGAHKMGCRAPAGRSSADQGEPVSIMVRPEKILIRPQGTDSGLPGKIQSHVYLGESTRWTIRLANGSDIQVVEQNRAAEGSVYFAPGDDITLEWEPSSAVLLV